MGKGRRGLRSGEAIQDLIAGKGDDLVGKGAQCASPGSTPGTHMCVCVGGGRSEGTVKLESQHSCCENNSDGRRPASYVEQVAK